MQVLCNPALLPTARIARMGYTLSKAVFYTWPPPKVQLVIAYTSNSRLTHLPNVLLLSAEYPEWAIPCLQQFPIPSHPQGLTLFDVSLHNEIYPGSKLTHFKQIHQRSGIDYEDMVRCCRLGDCSSTSIVGGWVLFE